MMPPSGDLSPSWTTGHVGAVSGLSMPQCSPPSLSLHCHISPIEEISNEEQGECTDKWFCETQGKNSSSGAQRRVITQHGVEISLLVDKWEMV